MAEFKPQSLLDLLAITEPTSNPNFGELDHENNCLIVEGADAPSTSNL